MLWTTSVITSYSIHYTKLYEIVHRLEDLPVLLAEAEHQAGLGQHIGSVSFRVRKHVDCAVIAGAGIAHRMRQASHRLNVLCESYNFV